MKRIGILGGGQLGMLLSQSILRLGGEALVFDPDPAAPAVRAVKRSVSAPWDDVKSLAAFFEQCDVLTYEIENVPRASLKELEKIRPIFPSLSVLERTQSRILEKTFLKNSQLPYVNFVTVTHPGELEQAAAQLSFPLIAKRAVGGYDGKFQYLLSQASEVARLASQLTQSKETSFSLTVEEAVELHCELSCLTARSRHGEEIAFPIFRNNHVDHILDTTVIPADIPAELEQKLLEISLSATRSLELTGLLCTEFFICRTLEKKETGVRVGDFTIYINEFAPRPHNSGHVTMSALTLSQFDALARILMDIPLEEPKTLAPGYFCMGNLLGDLWGQQGKGPYEDLDLSPALANQKVIDVVIYGKREAKPKRKMGHLITYASTASEAQAAVMAAKQSLRKKPLLKN